MNETLRTHKFAETCGHCDKSFEATATSFRHENIHDQSTYQSIWGEPYGMYEITVVVCPNKLCQKPILYLEQKSSDGRGHGEFVAYPPFAGTKPPRLEEEESVPGGIREIWEEAHIAVKTIPRIAGLIVRVCLETVLREKGYGSPGSSLQDRIKKAKNASDSPIPDVRKERLFQGCEAIAGVGNSAGHYSDPVGVPEDHSYSLEVIGQMIGYYYGTEAKDKRLKALGQSALTQKQAGKNDQLR